MQAYKSTARKQQVKAMLVLLAVSFAIQTPYAFAADANSCDTNTLLSKVNLPAHPNETGEELWLTADKSQAAASSNDQLSTADKSNTAKSNLSTTFNYPENNGDKAVADAAKTNTTSSNSLAVAEHLKTTEANASTDSEHSIALVPGPNPAAFQPSNSTSQTLPPDNVDQLNNQSKDEINAIAAATGEGLAGGRIVSDPSEAPSRIDDLTRQIILKEISLERFNLNFKLNSAKQGRWKGWRYAASNETSGVLGLIGGIIGTQQRGSHIHKSSGVKNYIQQRANFIPMIGTILAGSAAALELSINEYHEYEAFKKGFSPGKAREHVNGLKTDIDRLLMERNALIKLEQSAPLLTGRVQIDELESRVLADLRDQSLLEYQRFHLASRRLLAFQQCQYLFDFSKNTTNSLGYAFGYLALHRRRRPWNLKAGIMFDVCGALTMAGPIVSRVYAKGISEYHKGKLKETIADAEAKECSILERDQKALDAACKAASNAEASANINALSAPVQRVEMYGDRSKVFQDQVQRAAKDLDRAKLVATQNIGASMYVGASKLASGILFTIPGYFQLYNGKTETSSRVTNHLLFASGIVGLPATSFSLLDTLRIQVRGELNRKQLAAQGKLPGQLIKNRLAQLDALETKLSSTK